MIQGLGNLNGLFPAKRTLDHERVANDPKKCGHSNEGAINDDAQAALFTAPDMLCVNAPRYLLHVFPGFEGEKQFELCLARRAPKDLCRPDVGFINNRLGRKTILLSTPLETLWSYAASFAINDFEDPERHMPDVGWLLRLTASQKYQTHEHAKS